MRERSSPGFRCANVDSEASSRIIRSSSVAFLPNFDEVYQSVERTGGIGSSVSNSNILRTKRHDSHCSLMESARKSVVETSRQRSLSKHSKRNAILGEHGFKIQREVIERVPSDA